MAAFLTLGKVDGYQATPELSRVSGVFRDDFRTFPITFKYSVRPDRLAAPRISPLIPYMKINGPRDHRNPTIKKMLILC